MSYDSRPETYEHIGKVQFWLHSVIEDFLERSRLHDATKLVSPEVEMFDEFTPKLAQMEYGSDEYKAALEAMGPALLHHYENNPHHPEHYKEGIEGMTLMDVIEMVCDWKAASERTDKGDIFSSLDFNAKRFNISPQLQTIIRNTAEALFL